MADRRFVTKQNVAGQRHEKAETRIQAGKGHKCPNCGAVVAEHSELCPGCMHPVHSNGCTFCGAALLPADRFCPECGSPVSGVPCPKCGTVNFRNFCFNCHEPVTTMAQEEIVRALADPAYQKMVAVAKELASLEEILTGAAKGNESPKDVLSAEDIEMINHYRGLISELSNNETVLNKTPDKETIEPETKPVQNPDTAGAMALYRQKVQEINDILKEFAPDADATPQMQRDYYSARKIPVTYTIRQKSVSGWVCNYCGFFHNVPEECAEPWHGGTWQYSEIEVSHEKWVTED